MAIKQYSYLDIPSAVRVRKAAEAQANIRKALSDPSISNDQKQNLQTRLMSISSWAAGTLPGASTDPK